MAIINRKSGMVSGPIGDESFYPMNGMQCVRKAAGMSIRKNSAAWVETKSAFGVFKGMWRELPSELKATWDMYAAAQGCASDVETNDNVSYRCCPISNYPPRPKLCSGFEMFVGANVRAHILGLSTPRLYAPAGLGIPPLPLFKCDYRRSTGELIINMEGATLSDSRDIEAIKAVIWLSAFTSINKKKVRIVSRKILDVFDLPRVPEKIERRYTGIATTQKPYDYKPLVFGALPYVRVFVGAQIAVSYGEKWAPIISAGNWMAMYLLNQTQYIEIADLIEAGLIKSVGYLRFTERTARTIAQKREELAKKEFIKVSEV